MPRLTKKISKPDLAGALGHEAADKRIDILRRIAQGGSISEAARRCGVSYKAAWQAIETLGNLAGTPMVDKLVGGSGGGGTVITPAGLHVLEAAQQLGQARNGVLAALARARPSGTVAGSPGAKAAGGGSGHLAALALRTSMRNQFPCQVLRLKAGGGLVRVELQLPGAHRMQARITRESTQLLQLAAGLPVLALCKATAVCVAPHIAAAESRNVLAGTVARASRSAKGGEATLRLAGGTSLVGFAAAGTVLKVGQVAMASIDEAGVVIALPG